MPRQAPNEAPSGGTGALTFARCLFQSSSVHGIGVRENSSNWGEREFADAWYGTSSLSHPNPLLYRAAALLQPVSH